MEQLILLASITLLLATNHSLWYMFNIPLVFLHELAHYTMSVICFILIPSNYVEFPKWKIYKFNFESISIAIVTHYYTRRTWPCYIAALSISIAPAVLYALLPIIFPQVRLLMMIELLLCIKHRELPTLWLSDMDIRNIAHFNRTIKPIKQ